MLEMLSLEGKVLCPRRPKLISRISKMNSIIHCGTLNILVHLKRNSVKKDSMVRIEEELSKELQIQQMHTSTNQMTWFLKVLFILGMDMLILAPHLN